VTGYLRFESARPNSRGAYPGIFGLANGLTRSGRLSPADRRSTDPGPILYEDAVQIVVDPHLR
jgi:hypothetical protein